MARIIAVGNQKGGVGKTTTTLTLGAALRARGKRVLLVDMDSQECLETGLGLSTPPPGKDLATALVDGIPLGDVLLEAHGMSVAPAGVDLAEVEGRFYGDPTTAHALKDALAPLRRRFDYILIDCPPNLGPFTINALAAAQEAIIPVQAEFYALRRVGAFLRAIQKVRKHLNPSIKVLSCVPTMYDARVLQHREVFAEMRKALEKVSEPIPRTIRVTDSATAGLPLLAVDADNPAAQAYVRLAQEVDR